MNPRKKTSVYYWKLSFHATNFRKSPFSVINWTFFSQVQILIFLHEATQSDHIRWLLIWTVYKMFWLCWELWICATFQSYDYIALPPSVKQFCNHLLLPTWSWQLPEFFNNSYWISSWLCIFHHSWICQRRLNVRTFFTLPPISHKMYQTLSWASSI